MAAASSKEAQAYLIDPMNAPEPSAETGPGAHFTSTFSGTNENTSPTNNTTASPRTSLGSKNPFRENASPTSPSSKTAKASVHERGSSREAFPSYRADAFSDYTNVPRRSPSGAKPPPAYEDATAGASGTRGRRRTSSLKERYPGDKSGEPLSIIRKESRKAARSPYLKKQNLPGPDLIDRLDPAIGGVPYHHEGPYDAAGLARNRDPAIAPVKALEESNAEALKATPKENVRDAIEKHKPLDGVAYVPPGVPDRFGRTYEYEEGDDMMRERGEDEGYKRWPGKTYDPEDLKGHAEPTFTLDRALKAHKINDDGIEMENRAHLMKDYHRAERKGTLDPRDPVEIAGDDAKYADLERKNAHGELGDHHGDPLNYTAAGSSRDADVGVRRSGSTSIKEGLKKRIGSIRRRKDDA